MSRPSSFLLPVLAFTFLSGCQGQSETAAEYPPEVTALATEGGKGLPYLVGKDMRPVWKLEGAPAPRTVPPFKFKDQDDKEFGTNQLKGKITIVSFFFSDCPGICPLTIRNLKAVQEKFRNDDRFVMLSLSITPERDTPEQLKDFADSYKIDSRRWHLLTGDRLSIYRIARDCFSADTISPAENDRKAITPKDFLHSENVYLVDADLRLRGVYAGRMPSSINELMRDAEILVR